MTHQKQIYIPQLKIDGTYIEEIGGGEDLTAYPGESFSVSLSMEDFASREEYHSIWIGISKAVKKKLSNEAPE